MSGTMWRVSVIWMWPERRWNAMERLYSTSNSTSNSHPPARHGQSLGKVEPVLASSDVQTERNLLESKDGPVAQKDRAAVS